METAQQFKLIDGKFEPSEARSVLFALINSKINFHSLESFGISVRSSGDTSFHDKRINELRQAYVNISKFLDYALNNNCDLEINGNININLVPKK
jgi:hypothetical protein